MPFGLGLVLAGRGEVTFLQPTEKPRLNELMGLLSLILGICIALSLVSYYPFEPSWNRAETHGEFRNLIGKPGAYGSDLVLQVLGVAAYVLPGFAFVVGWYWIRSTPISRPIERFIGAICFVATMCTGLALSQMSPIFQS